MSYAGIPALPGCLVATWNKYGMSDSGAVVFEGRAGLKSRRAEDESARILLWTNKSAPTATLLTEAGALGLLIIVDEAGEFKIDGLLRCSVASVQPNVFRALQKCISGSGDGVPVYLRVQKTNNGLQVECGTVVSRESFDVFGHPELGRTTFAGKLAWNTVGGGEARIVLQSIGDHTVVANILTRPQPDLVAVKESTTLVIHPTQMEVLTKLATEQGDDSGAFSRYTYIRYYGRYLLVVVISACALRSHPVPAPRT